MFDFLTKDIIQHLGYIFTFFALSIKDVLWLRVILATAQIILGVYQFITMRYDVVFWNFIFTCVNLYHILRIIQERKPVKIPEEIKDIYTKLFNKMTSREFLYFWNLGEFYIDKNKTVIKEGHKVENLYLVLHGSPVVSRESKKLAILSRGSFIAEMSLVTEEPATADVIFNQQVKCMLWNQEQLRHLKRSNPDFWIKLHDVLSSDLIQKMKA